LIKEDLMGAVCSRIAQVRHSWESRIFIIFLIEFLERTDGPRLYCLPIIGLCVVVSDVLRLLKPIFIEAETRSAALAPLSLHNPLQKIR
jgi:hypothetical protein